MITTGIVPFKTPDGLDELAHRTRRLGQRHRTVLLLVDGRRTVDQVLALAHAAGVAEHYYRELVELGLVALPEGVQTAPTMPAALDEPGLPAEPDAGPGSSFHVELPVERSDEPASHDTVPVLDDEPEELTETIEPAEPAPAAVAEIEAEAPVAVAAADEPWHTQADSLLPSMQSLLPDSAFDDTLGLTPPVIDGPLEEAREILIRAVRTEAPVAGQLTLMKLKRAIDRSELEGLLDEVEARISRPRKMIVAAQTLRHVRHLLCMPPSTAFTMY